MLRSLQVRDHVVAQDLWPVLGSQRQAHARSALSSEMSNQIGVLAGHRSRRNPGGRAPASMRQTIVRSANRSHQSRNRPQLGCVLRPFCTIGNSFSVRFQSETGRRLSFIEQLIEEHNFPRDLLPTQGGELIEVIDDDHFRRDSSGRGWNCAAESGHHNFLGCAGSLPRVVNQFGGFYATRPARNTDLLKANFEIKFS